MTSKTINILGLDLTYWTYVFVLIFLIVFAIVVRYLLRRAEKRVLKKGFIWSASALGAIYYPLFSAVILVIAGSIVHYFITSMQLGFDWVIEVIVMIKVGVVLAVIWFLLSWKNRVRQLVIQQQDIPKSRQAGIIAITKILTVAIIIVGAITVLNILQIKVTALLTIGGVGAAAFAFASKDVIANFFGGLLLYMTVPFREGDSIQCPKQNFAGTVEEIGWYMTVIRNLNKQPIYVPNAIFTGSFVINVTRMSSRRLSFVVALRYQDMDKVEIISRQIKTMLDQHSMLNPEIPGFASLTDFADSSVNVAVVAYAKMISADDFRKMRQDLFLQIADIVSKNQADFAFPTQTIEMSTVEHETISSSKV